MVLPSVNDPNVLVLQGVKKAARGNYSCRVGNGIPTHDYEVESEPIFLDVKCKYNFLSRSTIQSGYRYIWREEVFLIASLQTSAIFSLLGYQKKWSPLK